ncbi:MAG TPA: hypothetical protein VF062_11615 [Candidatus Limnocylindrales bacterium]
MIAAVVIPLPNGIPTILAVGYALAHGIAETLGLPLRAPGLGWEVPAAWLKGRGRAKRILIWGATLGPGLVTRNPYAGMWFVPLLLATTTADPFPAAAAGAFIGLAHGTARAAGIIANRRGEDCQLPWRMTITRIRFRLADGLCLLFAAGVVIHLSAGHVP